MYGNSKKWVATAVKEKEKTQKLNKIRDKICPRSPFWSHDMDMAAHTRDFDALLQRRFDTNYVRVEPTKPTVVTDSTEPVSAADTISPSALSVPDSAIHSPSVTSPSNADVQKPASEATPKPVSDAASKPASETRDEHITSPEIVAKHPCTISRKPFSGKTIAGPEHTEWKSYVLCVKTVFTPNFACGKEHIASWPSRTEQKYEGDDRIATDKLHGRFPGAPRVQGNETVNWQHRNVIAQYDFENYHYIPREEEVFFRTHYVDEADLPTEEEAVHMLGSELLEMLDPVDQL